MSVFVVWLAGVVGLLALGIVSRSESEGWMRFGLGLLVVAVGVGLGAWGVSRG